MKDEYIIEYDVDDDGKTWAFRDAYPLVRTSGENKRDALVNLLLLLHGDDEIEGDEV